MLFQFLFVVSTKASFPVFSHIYIKNKVIFVPVCAEYDMHWDSSGGTPGSLYVLLKLIVYWDFLKIFHVAIYHNTIVIYNLKIYQWFFGCFKACMGNPRPAGQIRPANKFSRAVGLCANKIENTLHVK